MTWSGYAHAELARIIADVLGDGANQSGRDSAGLSTG
jgi:hypothetical protein